MFFVLQRALVRIVVYIRGTLITFSVLVSLSKYDKNQRFLRSAWKIN